MTRPGSRSWTTEAEKDKKGLALLLADDAPGSASSEHEQTQKSAEEQKLPSYLASGEKVCVVCRYFCVDYYYSVYIIDLKSESNIIKGGCSKALPSLDPVLRLDANWPAWMAVAVCRSKLFMFGGRHFPILAEDNKIGDWEKHMYICDISKACTTATAELRKGPDMKAAKNIPTAVVIQGNIICVFSTVLYLDGESDDLQFPNFEVFDPISNSWIELHEPFNYRAVCDTWKACRVDSYCVHNSEFFVSTNYGVYTVDLSSTKMKQLSWKELDMSTDVPRVPFTGGGLLIDNMCFTPISVYYILPGPPLRFGLCVPISILCLEKEKSVDNQEAWRVYCSEYSPPEDAAITCLGERRLCVVQTGFEPLVDCFSDPYLLVNAFNFDTMKSGEVGAGFYDELPDEQLQLTAIKSFKYILTGIPCDMVNIGGVFPYV